MAADSLDYCYFTTNAPEGWAHHFAAHLIVYCCIPREKVWEVVSQQSREALAKREHSGTLSDLQCVMILQDWFFTTIIADITCHAQNRIGKQIHSFDIEPESLDYWIKYIQN